MNPLTRRVRLRSAVAVAFGLGALLLSTALALGTYLSARHLLIDQRERTATRQAFIDATVVRDNLLTPGAAVSDVLGSISPPAGTVLYVHRRGQWYSSSLDPADEVTSVVRATVEQGSVAQGWTGTTQPSSIVVGIPLPAVDAEYYEVAVATELDETLATLRVALLTGAGLTTVAGALLGWFASRRILTPMTDVAEAASRVSGGDLSTRLRETEDPDLAPLVGAFNNMVDTLDARIEQDARFAADVAHELRTPVTTLTTSLSLLQKATDLSPRSEQAVALMSVELRRFTRALEDLLALGRLDHATREGANATVGAADLVREALGSSGRDPALLAVGGVAAEAVRVTADAPQLRRALVNLFDNADIHGGGLVRCRVVTHGEVVDVQVEDHGPGIPSEDRERVFERFARAGSRKDGTGSGLGLSIVAQTVRNHGGSVWCSAADGGGALVTLRLPRAGEEQ